MSAQAKLADLVNRVKPDELRQQGTGVAESVSSGNLSDLKETFDILTTPDTKQQRALELLRQITV